MEFLLEIIIQFLGEVLLQILAESLFEGGLGCIGQLFERRPNRLVASIAYVLLGTMAGIVSLWIMPHSLITGHTARIVGTIVIPLLCAAAMVPISRWLGRRGAQRAASIRFLYAFLFAFAMTLVRFRGLP